MSEETNQPWGKLWNGPVECKHCGLWTANAWIGNLSTPANIPDDNCKHLPTCLARQSMNFVSNVTKRAPGLWQRPQMVGRHRDGG
jgi:hypothetical protein